MSEIDTPPTTHASPPRRTAASANGAPIAERFRFRIRVYWEDTDAGGVVFYANYLKFFERARTEWLRSTGIGQQALRDECGGMFVVIETAVKYRQPARLDDLLDVTVAVKEPGRIALVLTQQAWRDDTLIAEGDIRIAFVDGQTLRPRRIPDSVLRCFA